MPETSFPSEVADKMVEKLFEGRRSIRFERVLVPGCGRGELIDAVARYCRRKNSEMPTIVAIDTDEEKVEAMANRYPGAEMLESDFLGDPLDLGRAFDFVLSDPPRVDWQNLDPERKEAYAASSGVVTTADQLIDSDLLFIEQSLRYLDDTGRAVFFTQPEYKTVDSAADIRRLLFELTESITDVNPDEYPQLENRHVITTISNELAEGTNAPIPYDPSNFEALLGRNLEDERPFMAQAVMTDNPKTYSSETMASEVYLDLVYNDYDAGVVVDGDEDIVGYVSKSTIRAHGDVPISEQVQRIDESVTIEPMAELDVVISQLEDNRFVFVRSDEGIEGIVTRYDLNRLPVFLHLYDLFSAFEIGLRRLIREEVPEWGELTSVSVPRRSGDNLYVDRLAGAKLTSLVDIVEDVGIESSIRADIHGYEVTLSDLVDLRNAIAHYNPIIHTMSDARTIGDDERGARQLAKEYELLCSCNDGLTHGG